MLNNFSGGTNTLAIGYNTGLASVPLSTGAFDILNSLSIGYGGSVIHGVATTRVDGISGGGLLVNGQLTVNAGLLMVTNSYTAIGDIGYGSLTINGGTMLVRDIVLGNVSGSYGMLMISSGKLQAFGMLTVATGGAYAPADGQLSLNGGQLVTTNSAVNIGDNDGPGIPGNGLITVSNGNWLAKDVNVGYGSSAIGTLIIAGGTNVLSGTLSLANNFYSQGSVLLLGGQLTVTNNSTIIGAQATTTPQMTVSNGTWRARDVYVGSTVESQGTLTIAGGTSTISWWLDIGRYSGATGNVWLTGGQLVTTNASTNIGNNGVGRMTVTGGSWQAGNVYVSAFTASQGTLTIAGGTNTIQNQIFVGFSPGANGTILLNGGNLIATNGGTFVGYGDQAIGRMDISGGEARLNVLYVGVLSNSTGTMTMSGGSLNPEYGIGVGVMAGSRGSVLISGGQIVGINPIGETQVGGDGTGDMTVNGGNLLLGNFIVGASAGSSGTLVLNGGTITVVNAHSIGLGAGSAGIAWIYSGQLNATNPTSLIQVGTGGNGMMAIYGGTVNARQLSVGNGTGSGTLYFGGGTLTGGSLVIGPNGLLQLGSGWLSSIVSNQGVIQFYTSSYTFRGGLDNLGNLNLPVNQIVNVQNGLGNEGGVIIAGASSVLNADTFRNASHNGIMFLNNAAQLNVTAAWTNNGAIELAQATLGGGTIQNASLIEGQGAVLAPVVNRPGGTIRASSGLLALVGVTIQNQGGVWEALPGSTLRINRSVANQGIINNRGGDMDFGSNTLSNQGTLSGFGGFSAAQIVNQTRAQFSGGQADIQAAYLNSAGATTIVLHAIANFFGAFTNAAGAYFKNTGSDVTFFSVASIGGTYVSDPAINTFNGSVVLDPTGVLAGGAGDVFIISGDLTSANPDGLQLAGAKVVFNAGAHTFTIAGPASIGELELQNGASILLAGGDLIVGLLSAQTNQFTTAQTIYYDPTQNPSLGAQTYALNGGGSLTAVPEPSSALLVLLGVVAAVTAARRRDKYSSRSA